MHESTESGARMNLMLRASSENFTRVHIKLKVLKETIATQE